ncbi:hypothetical protein LI99_08315 [Mycolicibacterium smegmatis]|uniref:Uncharacterized protein n=1 Tax=Mycolicibacterium smegmatis (strain ATCC 700084 / mc(2)155) TaxID=246196 RepID=A0QT03_MYCS2|nr:hypothetical protein MSMEG_1664 [Mycolicibacterium smegmatis MC2 155]AIU13520.1 hypothetical protein LI99_08315 [Mycolicibacterium smegmatis]AIU06895.1 hypothetical protein LJ00_08315 [Mycolicibacterium smegmatis MC2 155]AIU20144.1 hypothetical protein LI98_08315 [Mycolicibacterium smegmatis]TBH33824.1 hypothetical protein EYS45_21050 [Mycolicibacterium smegmatis MC2 155]
MGFPGGLHRGTIDPTARDFYCHTHGPTLTDRSPVRLRNPYAIPQSRCLQTSDFIDTVAPNNGFRAQSWHDQPRWSRAGTRAVATGEPFSSRCISAR